MTRLLRIELRRNASLVLLPVIAVLWLIWPIGPHLTQIALWGSRSMDIQGTVIALGPFAAGAGAWTAYREHRHGACDLLATTPRAAATRGLTTLAASAVWAALGYVAPAVVILVITSQQATWGHPLVLPLLDGLLAVTASSALGFACGRLVPGRFTAPLVAVGLLGLLTLGAEAKTGHVAFVGALSPAYPSVSLDASVFFPVQPDLAVLQCAGAIGVTGAALGATVWHAGARRIGLAVATTGVVLVGAAAVLVSSGHRGADNAIMVPALDSVGVRQPLPYTPVCGGTPLRVCVHPAYEVKLAVLASALNRLAAPLADTPGLPHEIDEGPIYLSQVTTTHSGVLEIPPVFIQGDTLGPESTPVNDTTALAFVDAPGEGPAQADDAQRAVALYLIQQAGADAGPEFIPTSPAIRAAAARLAARSPAARHTWLATHIVAVRAGTADLP
jgi:hypothetical protein